MCESMELTGTLTAQRNIVPTITRALDGLRQYHRRVRRAFNTASGSGVTIADGQAGAS
ncbi:hypothetical protein [Propionivibrio sp.]|uniref:hypothetical protein n=1 Tax=Propionivibrio sp. TaxID=2212460 RepID=UPI0025E431F0|nr:hypothetical protein [Propionivibrio sp.]